MNRDALKRTILLRFSGGAALLGALIFGTAGTFRYWEAWAYLATLFLPVALVAFLLLRDDPGLLERRMAFREERPRQRAVVKVATLFWLAVFLIPGLDHRFGWSAVPPLLVVLADALSLAGYAITALTLRENSFASRTIRVEEGQSVITTGPYAVVRHPMYLGLVLMMLAAPVALGSWWALLPALVTPVTLAMRIGDEEAVLLEQLPGYEDYTRRVRHRLVPGVW
jgi:protein-S-isoprenylcysteine O-methyltransferase Ste14